MNSARPTSASPVRLSGAGFSGASPRWHALVGIPNEDTATRSVWSLPLGHGVTACGFRNPVSTSELIGQPIEIQQRRHRPVPPVTVP